ncbi:MAG: methylglyoxal synthase [Schleiferiaceae bacterium]|nr:methylglyoxal synthase [Schleiferiaceae bacterium]
MKNIVILAHDRMKPTLASFIKEREDWLFGRTLVATGRSADFIKAAQFKVPVKHLAEGRSGGYREIIERIENGEVDMVLFFVDPDLKVTYHEDIQDLMDCCMRKNVPLANNAASAELLILGQIRKEAALKKRP